VTLALICAISTRMDMTYDMLDGASVLGALALIGVVAAVLIYRHARTKLKLSRETIRDAEFPGRG